MALKFFHFQKTKKFHVPYRFYDPDKEDREDREKRMKEELGIVEEADHSKPFKPTLKGQFRQSQGQASKSDEYARRNSNIRLIVLILVLSLIFYLFFYR